MAFLTVHIAASVLDTYVHIPWTAIVVPFASSYKSLWVALGSIGIDLLLAVAVSSMLRHKIRARTWSGSWDIDDETWARTAEPVIERLLALPDPDRPRRRRRAQRLGVFSRR